MGFLFADSKKVVQVVLSMDFDKVVFEWVAWLKSGVFFSANLLESRSVKPSLMTSILVFVFSTRERGSADFEITVAS